MWVSKRKWNEMDERIRMQYEMIEAQYKTIREIETNVNNLTNCHNLVYPNQYRDGYFTHKSEKINTQNINDITLEKLAKYIIDGEPLVGLIKKEYKFEGDKR